MKNCSGHPWGKVHGCIVDIDFCNHLYLNPFDGNVIRVWKDAVLSSRFGSQSNVLEIADHQVD